MAIAFDNSGVSSGTGDRTLSFTAAAGATLILAGVVNSNAAGDTVTGVTWNGNAMTLIAKKEASGGALPFWSYLFAIAGSDTGTHNVVTAGASGGGVHLLVASWTGTDSNVPANFATNSVNNVTVSTISVNVTVAGTNSWVAALAAENEAGGDSWSNAIAAGRATDADTARSVGDSDGTVVAGVQTCTWSSGGSARWWNIIAVEILEGGAAAVGRVNRSLNLMGVGQ